MVGSICSVIVVFIVAKAIGLDTAVMNSMLPGDNNSNCVTNFRKYWWYSSNYIVCSYFQRSYRIRIRSIILKTFRVKHPIAKGLALGTAGHALGVAVGIEMGEATMASIAVTVVGVVTVVVIPMFMPFIG